jgi:CDP-glucose 4,6-dehydratase
MEFRKCSLENLVTMKDQLINTYFGKRVFITGHTGFKGAWLVKILSLLGAEVKGYALAPKNKNDLYNLINGDSICQSIIGDIRDRKFFKKELLDFNPDFIFHLAAQPLVLYSYEEPIETFEVNSLGTAYLLDCIRAIEHSVKTIFITTDKIYHNREWIFPYRENDRLGGYDPYSASKACAELIISSYRNSFFNDNANHKSIAVARAGNVIGGGDWSENRLIPDIAIAFSKDIPVKIRNASAVRPWQHVLEPLTGYLILGSKLTVDSIKYSDAFNFGPDSNDTLTVLEMVELVIKHWGKGEFELTETSQKPHEAGLLKLDISKANEYLNWKPVWCAKDAVKKTIDWYKAYFENPNSILSFTEKQIIEYLNHE